MTQPVNWKSAKLGEIKLGDTVIVDAGFTCIPQWTERLVRQDENGELFIECSEGRHYLSGQENRAYGTYAGLMLKEGN